MKKILSLIIALVMLVSLGTPAFAAEDPSMIAHGSIDTYNIFEKIDQQYVEEYKKLSPAEKDARLKTISNTYTTAGQVLSERDSAFIILRSIESKHEPKLQAGAQSKWYDVYKTQYGVTVNLYGNMKQDICFVAGSSRFGGIHNSMNKIRLSKQS